MTTETPHDFLFLLFEVQRLLRLFADKEASRYGLTRAQWAVLAKLERSEGLKQTELAELMEMQPITLTRLIDRLCANDLIERRSDPNDRRANRLYLRPAAKPLLELLAKLRAKLTETALAGMSSDDAGRMLSQFASIKDNIRAALQSGPDNATREQRYG